MMMDEKLKEQSKFLRLTGLIENWNNYTKKAQQENYSNIRFLKYIIEEEYNTKKENSRRLRLNRAGIPEKLVIETFPFNRQPKLNKKKILNIYDSMDYVYQKRNIIMVGNTGVGKTGLATSFLINAINQGYKGRFINFNDLVNILYRSVADHSEEEVLKKFDAYDCLLIDELGYIEIESIQVGLFFSLLQKRHKTKSTIITTNLGFAEWNSFLKNTQLTAALIDRLTENSHVLNMKNCISLRKKPVQF
jgi:DNA replication protein DnaC